MLAQQIQNGYLPQLIANMRYIIISILLLVLSSCATTKPISKSTTPSSRLYLHKTSFAALPGWDRDRHDQAHIALKKSCSKILKKPNSKSLGAAGIAGNASDWKRSCNALAKLTQPGQVKSFFEKHFTPFRVASDNRQSGLFTGYYEITLFGSDCAHSKYIHPIYKTPTNLKDIKHKLSRKEINQGKLSRLGLELLYVDDPVALFFLHIQGSGRVHLADGQVIKVGYAAQNGHPYYAIGKYLKEHAGENKININGQTIQDWLKEKQPHHAKKIMERNASYVFFRIVDGESPIGAQGVALTAERSLAVDPRFIPLGVPLWLDTTYPAQAKSKTKLFQKLMVAQDTGGAIKGVIRGDVYFGHGKQAEQNAFNMNTKGSYYLLLPKTITKYKKGHKFGPFG